MASRTPKSSWDDSQKISKLERANTANPSSYLAKIVKAFNTLAQQLVDLNPDAKHNTGRRFGELYVWDELAKYAKGRSDALWKELEDEGIVATNGLEPGLHSIGESPHFVINAEITQPVRRFDSTVLANWFNKSKYKVPVIITKEQIDHAKVPTNGQTRLRIEAR